MIFTNEKKKIKSGVTGEKKSLFRVLDSKRFFLCACPDGDSAAGGTGTQGAILGKSDAALRPCGGSLGHVPRAERHASHSVQVGPVRTAIVQLEALALKEQYLGSQTWLYDLVEAVSDMCPEQSVMHLIQYR